MRILKADLDGRMNQWVGSLPGGGGAGLSITDHIDLSRLDREQIPGWIKTLRAAEADVRRVRSQLEAVLADDARRCPVCDGAVTGRADQVYCGATCRQRARRARV